MATPVFIIPDWPAPANVKAAVTTRQGGTSLSPYDSFNLAAHVGDDPAHVAANRALLRKMLTLPSEPLWLNQTHSTIVVRDLDYEPGVEGDASCAGRPGPVCAVLTADCLPLLVCNRQGNWIAAIHAGWQGLARGVIEAGIAAYPGDKTDLLVWLGPAIGPQSFEVRQEVIDACTSSLPGGAPREAAARCFNPVAGKSGFFLGDLYALARLRLARLGVMAVFGGNFCTYLDSSRFFSYRRDNRDGTHRTGRLASLIWLSE